MDKNLKSMTTMHRMQQTGLELFYKQGFYNTSVDDILKSLGLSKGAFYYHYPSKEEFFINIVQQLVFRKVYSMLIEPVEGRNNPLHAIEVCLDEALETAEHNTMDYGFVLANFINEFNGRNEQITKYLTDICKVWEVNLVATLQKGKTDGFVERHVDSEAVATYIISSYFGIRTLMVSGNKKVLRYQYIQQLRNYFRSLSPVVIA
ncbi:TetR/AcrR family transcriptional regulator [Robiginitalea sp. M366]|uniref:TetR/AcrR family transcriptional regulator n=1 Tax=Robiginitalea aestuariiviva TaxID=3036903 RepID=UPI00240D9124|nr:TetR/AcrR family transcriptional regulator [Robiginitalea aestuariiviva]MDG1571460.1 TetR/AcrR family transcriptional regulator [Robiginitalea aestuariiviva]